MLFCVYFKMCKLTFPLIIKIKAHGSKIRNKCLAAAPISIIKISIARSKLSKKIEISSDSLFVDWRIFKL